MSIFKKSKTQDERINHIKNKIYAEIYILIVVICGISIIVKDFIYHLGAMSVVTELSILIISGFYYIYRTVKLGIYSAEVEIHDRKSKWSVQRKNLFISIALGIVIAFVFGMHSAVTYADGLNQGIYYFFLTAIGSLMIYLPFFIIFLVVGNEVMKRESEKAEDKMLDHGDDDEEY